MFIALGVSAAVLLSGCAPEAAPEKPTEEALEGPLVVHSRGGTIGEAERKLVWDPFTAETGVEVIQVEIVDVAPAVKTQVETGNVELDLALITKAGYGLLSECCLEKIDYSAFGGDSAKVIESMPDGAKLDYAVATTTIGFNLAFDTRAFPEGKAQPKTWADFWNVDKFPGKRAIYGNPFYLLEVALLADGVKADKLYPLDVDRAFKKIEELKPNVVQLWTQGAQGPQLLDSGEAAMVMSYNGRLDAAIAEGASIGYSWQGALTYHDYMAIPKGAKHKKAAMAALEFMLRPEIAAALGEVTGYPAPSPLVWEAADADARKTWPNAPDIMPGLVQYEGGWWSETAADGSGRTNQEWLTERLTALFSS